MEPSLIACSPLSEETAEKTRDLHLTAQKVTENTGPESSPPATDVVKPQPTVERGNGVEDQASQEGAVRWGRLSEGAKPRSYLFFLLLIDLRRLIAQFCKESHSHFDLQQYPPEST